MYCLAFCLTVGRRWQPFEVITIRLEVQISELGYKAIGDSDTPDILPVHIFEIVPIAALRRSILELLLFLV